MERHGTCPNCGWWLGAFPIAQSGAGPNSAWTFVAEPRRTFRRALTYVLIVFGLTAIFASFGFFASRAPGSGVAALLFGPACIYFGVQTLRYTHNWKVWWGLDQRDKYMALPGLVLAVFIGVMMIPILVACWLLLVVMPGDIRRELS